MPAPVEALPPLPAIDESLYIIHFSTGLQDDFPDQPVPVLAIIAQQYVTGDEFDFSAFDLFAREGANATDFRAEYPKLERQFLSNFACFIAAHSEARWLHWRFPFKRFTQRACCVGLDPIDVPECRCFDLATHLKRRFGDTYAPDPRLWHAINMNLGGAKDFVPGVLSESESRAAWHSGAYALLHANTAARVSSISRLFGRVREGTFVTASATNKAGVGVGSSCPERKPAVGENTSDRSSDPRAADAFEAHFRASCEADPTLLTRFQARTRALVELMQAVPVPRLSVVETMGELARLVRPSVFGFVDESLTEVLARECEAANRATDDELRAAGFAEEDLPNSDFERWAQLARIIQIDPSGMSLEDIRLHALAFMRRAKLIASAGPNHGARANGRGGRRSAEELIESLPPLFDAAGAAGHLGFPDKSSALNTLLGRYRKKNPDCAVETANPRPTDPRYMYRKADIAKILRDWLKRVRNE